jgi:hypothetical protein
VTLASHSIVVQLIGVIVEIAVAGVAFCVARNVATFAMIDVVFVVLRVVFVVKTSRATS